MHVGQHPPPRHLLAHVSDTQFLGGGRPLYDRVDTDTLLRQAMRQLEGYGSRLDAMIFTGDIADLGEPDAYRRVRDIVEPTATRLGAELVWVMGNHDERSAFRTELLRSAPSAEPVDRVVDLGGLRVVCVDTSVPGYHHGRLDEAQLDWLAEVLAEPAPNGTLLAMHHPPLPTPMPVMQVIELLEQDRLAAVLRGTCGPSSADTCTTRRQGRSPAYPCRSLPRPATPSTPPRRCAATPGGTARRP